MRYLLSIPAMVNKSSFPTFGDGKSGGGGDGGGVVVVAVVAVVMEVR